MRTRVSRRTVTAVEIRLLGSLEVIDDDGNDLAVVGARLQTLLTVLALRCGEVVVDDQLVDALWGDDAPARSANALQRQVSTLRRILGSSRHVQRRASGYALTIDKSSIDIFRFDALAARGHEAMREGDVTRSRECFDEAVRLWRGNALADVAYEQFAQQDIARLTDAKLVATEARIDADLTLGRTAGLTSELEQLVLEYPLREHLRAQLMLALARSGRQADALRAYQSARAVLAEELGLEPSQELRALEAAILQQDEAIVGHDPETASPDPRTNLRLPLTTLIGRHHEMDALRQLLRTHRLVTLVGPGGVGKSRLAIEAAQEWLASGTTDVWLIELAEITSPDEIVPTVMTALDLPRAATADADLKRLIELLKTRPSLVVLDNCEHLVAAAARLAQHLLESSAAVSILATSREGLAIPSEVLWPVPPLLLDDAVALFVERGRSAVPAFDFAHDSYGGREALEGICRRLDGLPLAIELAAARLRAMTIQELAAGLEDRFRLLNRGARTALPRQQTLRAVVDWSYGLLFDDERRVFERLSVFGGSCSFAAARAVCVDDDITSDDVAELLTRLADKSLIIVEKDEFDGYARCRLLQTLVDYGRERLESSGDAARVSGAHVRYYADLAVRSMNALRGEKQRGWLTAVTANMENLRYAFDAAREDGDAETAQAIAGGLGWYWWFTGRAVEGSRWLDLGQACKGPVQDRTRARVMAWAAFTRAPGFARWIESDETDPAGNEPSPGRLVDDEIDDLAGRAIAIYRQADALEELAVVESALAVTYSTRGNHVRARGLLVDAEQLLAALPPAPWVSPTHAFVIALRAFVEDRYADAEQSFRISAEMLDGLGAEVHCAFALRYLGRLAARRGDYATSIEALERSLQLAQRLNLSAFANVLMTDLADSLAGSGDFERARAVLEHPLRAARDMGSHATISESLAALAMVEWRANDVDGAARLADEGLQVAFEVGNLEAGGHCLAILGYVAESRGRLAEARTHHTRAFDLAREAQEPRRIALALEGLAGVELLEGDAATAARLLGAATRLRRSPGRAAGWPLAAAERIDIERILAGARQILGSEEADRAYNDGEANPDAIIATVTASSLT